MWDIKKDCLLKDYIKEYSGVTIGYKLGERYVTKLIGYKDFESTIDKINNNSKIWSWYVEQTKEIRFIPSYASDKCQIAFILNMESSYAKELKKADIFNYKNDKEVLKYFVVESMIDRFMKEKINAFTTNREAAIFFGLPTSLIEGVLVGRKVEKDKTMLEHIKNKLPKCYICNLEGKVIK